MQTTAAWPLITSLAVCAATAVVIGIFGTRLSRLADMLADSTGLGEAFMGAVFLGASTSLPGITASVTAALHGQASLALANAFGGIAVQTAFLAIADLTYRRANLEHAAASLPNMLSGSLLIVLLAAVLLGMAGPRFSILGLHPLTPLLFAGYLYGLRLVRRSQKIPMWHPKQTAETRPDVPGDDHSRHSDRKLWLDFAFSAAAVVAAGWVLTMAAESIANATAISASVIGALLLAVVTSLPELVTTIAAVRRGALTLAVGGVLGGNTFDILFAAAADIAYRQGSIYHAGSRHEISLLALCVLVTAVMLTGLLIREKRGVANIGFESMLVLVIYFTGIAILAK